MRAIHAQIRLENSSCPSNPVFRRVNRNPLKKLGVTVLLITESYDEGGKYGRYGEDFLSDGIIYLKYHNVSETEIQLWMRCVKMRQVDHTKNYYALLHEDGHFQIARVISER